MRLLISHLLLLGVAGSASADTRLLRFPDISQTQVSFVYGGDIYVAPRAGGEAKRLTAHAGMELFPKFSPDGAWIAFSAEYSGTRQVYIMPSDGSAAPKQLTWYNDIGPMPPRGGYDYRVLDFSPDGKNILVRVNRLGMDERAGQPYWIPVAGGDERALAVPETGGGMLSPDGKQFVYTPIDREFRTWKRTRGGRAQDVWTFDLEQNKAQRLTSEPSTDNQPMWLGDEIYFTSDRDYTLNLYRMPSSGGAATKVTKFSDFDVLWPSAGAGTIVFENGGWLYTYAPGDAQPKKLAITVQGDRSGTLAQIKSVGDQIQDADLSAAGERAIFTARGEIFSVPRKNGPIRNISRTPDAREIGATISADGKSIAYLSDASGEYELYVRALDGGEPKQLSSGGKAWKLNPTWAPDGSALILADSENRLHYYAIDGSHVLIDQAKYGRGINEYVFAPNSRYVAYSLTNATGMSEIWVFDRQTEKKQKVLGGQFDADSPSFDPAGNYLYFTSNRDHQLSFSAYEFNYLYTNATRLFATSLRGSADSLFPQKSDEIGAADPKKPSKNEAAYDLDGLEQRATALPVAAGQYRNLNATAEGLLYIAQAGQGPGELKMYQLDSAKEQSIAAGVAGYRLSSAGSHVLLSLGNKWVLAEAKPGVDVSAALDLSMMRLRIEPKREWQQLYTDGLRVFREWFYDPNLHGNDWKKIAAKYEPLLASMSHRSDLDYVFGEIAGELNAGHAYVDRGDEVKVERIESGLLGASFERVSAGYRVSKIFPGQNWSEEFRSPFLEAGVDIKLGDVITAINGQSASDVQNFYQLLEAQGNQVVEIERERAGKRASVLVKTITAETNLRYLDWIQSRAAMVDKLSNGRIGYLHLPNTAVEGNRELFKQFPSQTTKSALIIDDRYNGGGFIPDRMIEVLARKPLNYWKRRGLEPAATPLLSHNGPKAMLINGLSSSGGDALPYYFRKLGLGKLIGTRTWGGLIGLSGNPLLADGGRLSAPDFRFMNTENQWAVENEGVSPDIEVIDAPDLLAAGRDPSLERAVSELLKQLDANPPVPVVTPPAPTDFGQPK